MTDLREDLLAARYQTENALVALEEGDAEAAQRHLSKVHRAIEVAGKRTQLPEEIYYQRIPRSAAAKIFTGGIGEGGP